MSERVTFGAKAATALIQSDRAVRDKNGRVWPYRGYCIEDSAPYTLAGDEPLTDEQTKAVCVAEPGLCFRWVDGSQVRRYDRERGWQIWSDRWVQDAMLGPFIDACYTLAPNPEVPQKAPEPQGDHLDEPKAPAWLSGSVQKARSLPSTYGSSYGVPPNDIAVRNAVRELNRLSDRGDEIPPRVIPLAEGGVSVRAGVSTGRVEFYNDGSHYSAETLPGVSGYPFRGWDSQAVTTLMFRASVTLIEGLIRAVGADPLNPRPRRGSVADSILSAQEALDILGPSVPTVHFRDRFGARWRLDADGLRYKCAGGGYVLSDSGDCQGPFTVDEE